MPSDASSRDLGGQEVDRELVDSGHRGDGVADSFPGDDEEWVDEVVGRKSRLAHEVAERGRAAKPTRALCARPAAEGLERLRADLRHLTSVRRSATRAPE